MELPRDTHEFNRLMVSRLKVKWYDTIVPLVGSVLAVVDPVTDILTLREFYLKDHKVWFGMGLAFVILPSLSMSIAARYLRSISEGESTGMGLIHGCTLLLESTNACLYAL